jgi:BirA family transcriptional regulator, biotin operon repressor / biotin---[acetyl-CoA-carboxylase] ligase
MTHENTTSPRVGKAKPEARAYETPRLKASVGLMKVHYFSSLKSTSDHAICMRQQGRLFAPAMVLTSKQTSGRGRGDAIWHSPPGVMTVTFAVTPSKTLPPQWVPLVAGLCVIDVARQVGVTDVQLKWPNDCWRWVAGEPRKIAGILCERRDNIDLIGIGLNVNLKTSQLTGRTRVTPGSLSDVVGPLDMTDVLIVLARAIDRRLIRDDAPGEQHLLREFEQFDALRAKHVRVIDQHAPQPIQGTATGIDAKGRLCVQDQHTRATHKVVSGTIELV